MNDRPFDNPFYILVCICMQFSEPEHQRCLIRANNLYTGHDGVFVQSEIYQKNGEVFFDQFFGRFWFRLALELAWCRRFERI